MKSRSVTFSRGYRLVTLEIDEDDDFLITLSDRAADVDAEVIVTQHLLVNHLNRIAEFLDGH